VTIRAQQPVRDPSRELAFFQTAARTTGAERFVEHARQRLEDGEDKFGERWTRLRLHEFTRELAEEAADLAAWAALAAQALDGTTSMPADHRGAITEQLSNIARAGAKAHHAIEAINHIIGGTPA